MRSNFLRPILATGILVAYLPAVSGGAQDTAAQDSTDSSSDLPIANTVPGLSPSHLQDQMEPDIAEYRIGPGDVLHVDVWKEPDTMSPATMVRPDGKISVPMLGDVQAAGLRPADLQRVLTDKYAEFIRNARVTVTIKEINSQKIYLIGEVKKEGPIRLQAPMNVLQALAEAGGVTDYAKRKKIYILRTVKGRQMILRFDYDAVVRGSRIEQNLVLLAGDTVIVPR